MAKLPRTGGERGILPGFQAARISRRLEVHDHKMTYRDFMA
jgi:hypothetical protein